MNTKPKQFFKKLLAGRAALLAPLALAALTASGAGMVLWSDDQSAHPLDKVYRSEISEGTMTPADPHTVLRRMSLQIRGVIPDLSENRAFERAPAATRARSFAVRFLRDPDYAHYWGTIFGDALRERTKFNRTKTGSYFAYLSGSLHANKPYDVMVREMLTATGDTEKNPAANFYIRDDGDPLQVAEYVGRVFYGARLNCARCHDHPFRRDFTRRDYYGFAAFFSQAWVRRNQKGDFLPKERMEHMPTTARKEYEEKRRDWYRNVWNKMSDKQRKAWREKNKMKYAEVVIEPSLQLRFPHTDYAPGGDLVKLKYPDGTRAIVDKGEDRREVFATWLTAKDNDRFRKVLINRVWTRLMGWSFFTPMDDWSPETEIQHEEILDHLDQVFLEKKYKIKDLILYIVTSDAYARSAPGANTTKHRDSIAYYKPRRMDASQLFNSLLRGTRTQQTAQIWERAHKIELESNKASRAEELRREVDLKGIGGLKGPTEKKRREFSNACEIPRPAHERTILAIFGEGNRNDVDDSSTTPTIDQVLVLLNGRMTGDIIRRYGDKNSWIRKDYMDHKDIGRTLDTVYRSLLSRPISQAERDKLMPMATSKFKRDRDFNQSLVQDLVWAVVMSQEFVHVY
ncbi:MAG: DUF1549 and DUF1553 domain-containing protein [bacterium]|nr:DUF1549 and DUF1553 domain-containing protein [bacterium]